MLYIVRFLHQTTTMQVKVLVAVMLYIVRFLYQTTTIHRHYDKRGLLYIVRFLHQTTTHKPWNSENGQLYIVRFLHQTTTTETTKQSLNRLYIVRFLHQTTTHKLISLCHAGCISSVSYIKPQLLVSWVSFSQRCISSVSYIKPQPFGCRLMCQICCISSVSYIKPQLPSGLIILRVVVYRPFPTSNHNRLLLLLLESKLYIVRFLHQTTTALCRICTWHRCISSVSYIKPQP